MPFKIIKTADGHYVENTITRKRYSRKPMTRGNARKQLQLLRTVYVHTGGEHGGAFFRNLYDRVAAVVTGARNDYQPRIRELLQQVNGYEITGIQVCREKVKASVNTLMNIISLGKFSQLKKKYGFDNFYHLYMVVEFNDTEREMSRRLKIEKNHVINISESFTTAADAKCMQVSDVPDGLTIDTFLTNAAQQMGKQYWQYDAFSNNCQVFINTLLKSNDLLTPELHTFIFQDIQQLAGDVRAATRGISSGMTNLAARLDTLAFGKGMAVCECNGKRKGRRK